jgi:hypothetical protein
MTGSMVRRNDGTLRLSRYREGAVIRGEILLFRGAVRGMRSPVRDGRAAIHGGMAARDELSERAALAKRRE